MNVILIGMKHCGKSTVGAALAERWSCPFFDLDAVIEQVYRHDTGQGGSVREIFSACGEDFFRRIECAAACELYRQRWNADDDSVIAVGGRTPTNAAAAALLVELGPIVYLQGDPEQLYQRIVQGGLPPFLKVDDPKAEFMRICRERAARYEQLASTTIDTTGLDAPAVVEKVIGAIKEQPDAR